MGRNGHAGVVLHAKERKRGVSDLAWGNQKGSRVEDAYLKRKVVSQRLKEPRLSFSSTLLSNAALKPSIVFRFRLFLLHFGNPEHSANAAGTKINEEKKR